MPSRLRPVHVRLRGLGIHTLRAMSPSHHVDRFRDAAEFGGRTILEGRAARGRSRHRRLAAIIAILTIAAGLVTVSAAVGAAGPVIIYDDAPGEGFQNWSWAETDLAATAEVHSGATAMAVDYGPWEGLYLALPTPTSLDAGATLEFWLHGGSGSTDPIQVVLVDGAHRGGTAVAVSPVPGQWTKHRLPVSAFGISSSFGGLWWQNATGQDRATMYIDDVRLVGGGDGPEQPSATGPELTVDLGARTVTRTITDPASGRVTNVAVDFPHPISDGVYGLNFAAPSLLDEFDPGVNRWGGNAVERYNHLTGITNLGKDYYFMNNPGEVGNDHRFEDANQAAGADTLLTVPAIGWVAGDNAARCGYPMPAYAPMDGAQPHFLDGGLLCGNGQRNGETVAASPETTSIPVGPAHTEAWVTDLVATHGPAADGGVELYAIGNEPGLWHETHADVVAKPVTRQHIITTNVEQAAAIKAADPTAAVAGPVLWSGFSYYVTSAEFAAGQRPGDVPTFVEDYLADMAAAGNATGTRLLDTLAINFYDDRVFWGGTDELRLQSTRSLWDPSYAPEDWWVVRDFVGEGSAVIPRMQSLINNNYPGTELSITEYNFGALDTLAGGLTQADALGIFGREGLDRAMLWDPFNEQLSPPEAEFANTPAMWAYRMYRNYDGAGSRFGDQALFAESADQEVLSIYAATRSTDGALTALVVNKSTSDQTSLLNTGTAGTAAVYNYGRDGLDAISRLDDITIDGSAVVSFPSRSITLLVLEGDGESPTTTSPTTIPPTTTAPTAPPTTEPTTSVPPTTAPPTTTPASTTPPTTTSPTTTPPTTSSPATTPPTTSSPTTTPPTTTAPTTSPPTTVPVTTPTTRPDSGRAFFEDFSDDGSFARFRTGIYHRDDWVVGETSWLGDHRPTGESDACSGPLEKRVIERGERAQGFDQGWIYRCRPADRADLAHLMTAIGDTSGYSIGSFTPSETFRGVTEVRWEVNITDLGARQFPEVKIIPVDNFDFQNLPCSIEWLPCNTDSHADLGSVGTSFFHAEPAINTGHGFVNGWDWDSGWRDTGTDPARQSIMIRRTHFFRDNGDGTLTFGIEKEDGSFETIDASGSFPSGEVKVVFSDHNYTPRKDEPADITFTWHWDDISITTR